MRLIVAVHLRDHVSAENRSVMKGVVQAANSALDRIQPWLEDNSETEFRWVPAGGRTALLFRSNEPETIPERFGWIGNKARAWAWSGVMGSQLRTSSTATDGISKNIWNGVGSFGLIGATPSSITLYTNAHRSEGLYWTELPDAIVMSNSAAVLNLMKHNGTLQYSRTGMAGFLTHGLPFIDASPFAGVFTAPAGAAVTSDENDDRRISFDQPSIGDDADSIEDAMDRIAEGLIDYAKVLAGRSEIVTAAITGGKDSRLVCAALHAAGIDFSTFTSGLPESGEAHVGVAVANALGVPHQLNTPPVKRGSAGRSVVIGTPEDQAWKTLKSTGGLGNCFTMMPDPATNHVNVLAKVSLGGQGGEIIRGGFARRLNNELPTASNAQDIMYRTWFNHRDMMTPFAFEAVESNFRPTLDSVWADPGRALFEGYVTQRTGRWLSTMRHGESVVAAHSTLLIDNRTVRLLKSLPSSALLAEKVAHGVMERLAPQIAGIPFFRDRWAFESDGPSDHYKPESWGAREPYTAHDQPRASFNWRTAQTPELSRYFKDYILSDPSSMLFELVDRQKATAMLDGKSYRAPLAWALYSAQYALNGDWLGPRPQNPKSIEIEVPS